MGRYPDGATLRDRFVLQHRGPRPPHDAWRHQGVIVEDERADDGSAARVATVFLTGRECPWRCAMCDLWKFTTASDTPEGAIPAQLKSARAQLDTDGVAVSGLKLYNAGSFFDPRAVPESDYEAAAQALSGLSRAIVESHPALVGPRVDRFLEALADAAAGAAAAPRLEVAMGLETAHPSALDRLNKRFTLDGFADAARGLADRGVALRVFLLINTPFIPAAEQDEWLARSVEAAFDCGASVASLVPTRAGNGTLDALDRTEFAEPDLADVERSLAIALAAARGRGRVFADLWGLDRFSRCRACLGARTDRLRAMNLAQQLLPPSPCGACGHAAA